MELLHAHAVHVLSLNRMDQFHFQTLIICLKSKI